MTTLGGRYYYQHPNFIDEENEAKKYKQLALSHKVGKWQSLDSELGHLASKPLFSIFQYNYLFFVFVCHFQ